uniref:Cytochrome P450 51 n=1 Tax=Ganoderma boninense TaxID=34458 RepID=A0A5K1K1S5_9APHY|nr:Cytochrome P450 51 [Ganoderma boninense]
MSSNDSSAQAVSRSGRHLRDSAKKKEAKESEGAADIPLSKRKRGDKDKENHHGDKGKGKGPEFNITPLSTNSTALKGTPINLQARKCGLPQPKSQPASMSKIQPATITAGHRHSQPSSTTPSVRKLSAEKAAELTALKSPFGALPSGRNGRSEPQSRMLAGSSTSTFGQRSTPALVTTTPQENRARHELPRQASDYPRGPARSLGAMIASGSTHQRTANSCAAEVEAHHTVSDALNGAERMAHYQVSMLQDVALEDSYSAEDDEQGIPRKFWIPSHLRQLAHHAVARLNDDNADENHAGAGHDFSMNTNFDNSSQNGDNPADVNLQYSDEQHQSAGAFSDDEHEGEYDDAPNIQDEDYDSDVPLAKRRRARDRDSSEMDPHAGCRKATRVREREEGKRPRVADYETDARHILLQAIPIFKSLVSSEDAYPDKLTEMTWAKQAWWKPLTSWISNLHPTITAYSWHLRGEVKTAARSLVETVYRFRSSGQAEIQLRNRERVAALRKDDAFVYRKRGPTADDHEGLYEADIIQQMANRIYFKDKKDDGVVLQGRYSPFPIVAFALIITAVECAIDEWTDGSFTKVPFTEDKYSPVYRHHLRELRQYEAASDDLHIVTRLCQWIYEDGRIYTKAGPDETLITRSLGARAYAKGIADFKRNGGRLNKAGEESTDEDN